MPAQPSSTIPTGFEKMHELPHGDVVCALTIANDSKLVYTGGKGNVKAWDLSPECEEPMRAIREYDCLGEGNNYVRACKLFNNGSHLVVAGEASSIVVYDVEQGRKTLELAGCGSCYYDLAIVGKQLYACGADGNVVVWDLGVAEKIGTLSGHSDSVTCVDITGDGRRLWTGGLDHTASEWDIRARRRLRGHDFDAQVFALACSPIDDWVAVGKENNEVELVHTTARPERHQLDAHESCVLSLKFAHSGKWFVSGGKDNVLTAWPAPPLCRSVELFQVEESSSIVACEISVDDRYVVTGEGAKTAAVFRTVFDR